MLIWLKKNGDNLGEWTFAVAALHGSLDNMIWLKDQGCPWDECTFIFAAYHGSLESVKWLKDQGCPLPDEFYYNGKKTSVTAWLESIGYHKVGDIFYYES